MGRLWLARRGLGKVLVRCYVDFRELIADVVVGDDQDSETPKPATKKQNAGKGAKKVKQEDWGDDGEVDV